MIGALSIGMLLVFAGLTIYVLIVGRRSKSATIGTKLRVILLALSFLAFANEEASKFLPFAVHGGDIENGKVEGGRFYLGNHGRYTEVSRQFWETASRYQDVSRWVFLVVFACTAIAILTAKRRVSAPRVP